MVLVLGTALIAIFSRERWRLDELGFMVLALNFGLTNVRFMFLAGILAPPIFARRLKLSTLLKSWQQNETAARVPAKAGSNRWLANTVVLVILGYVFIASAPRNWKLKSLIDYPDGAVAYMK